MTTDAIGRARLGSSEIYDARERLARVEAAFAARVVGQEGMRRALLVALMTQGHVLLESVPGLAKTLAASTLARLVHADFARIQCTPDLLPSDIIGTQVYDARRHEFETRLGPVHANFVLLDEINRASAKTQAAVLEAMQERQTSIAGEIHPLPRSFLVLATQNPIDEEGTYLLPHAQLDRFLLKEVVPYPERHEEVEVLDRVESGVFGDPAGAVIDLDDVAALQDVVSRVYVDRSVKQYIVDVVDATRTPGRWPGSPLSVLGDAVEVGASPRASIALFSVGRALAVMAGRDHVIPEDVQEMAHAVLRHRLHLTYAAAADGVTPEDVVDAVLATVTTP